MTHQSAVIRSLLTIGQSMYGIQNNASQFTSQSIEQLYFMINTLPDSTTSEQLNTFEVVGRDNILI